MIVFNKSLSHKLLICSVNLTHTFVTFLQWCNTFSIQPGHLKDKYEKENKGGTIETLSNSRKCYPEYIDGSRATDRRIQADLVPPELVKCFEYKTRKVGYAVTGDIVSWGYQVSGYECRLPGTLILERPSNMKYLIILCRVNLTFTSFSHMDSFFFFFFFFFFFRKYKFNTST